MSATKTILDYLNEDCWRLVLRYVPLQDIIRTEGSSRQWQRMVLTYLSHTRICIKRKHHFRDNEERTGVILNVRSALLRENMVSFEIWTHKLGASVVSAYCNVKSFNIIGETCPNLEGATFIDIPDEMLLNNQFQNFRRLQKLRFIDCLSMTDEALDQYIASPVLEELLILFNDRVTGQCFINIRSPTLKSLDLQFCKYLACRLLPAASDHFSELRKLVLVGINFVNYEEDFEMIDEPFDDILLVLKKTLKLEHLYTWEFGKYIDNFIESVCRLSCLKQLHIDTDGTDETIVAVTRCCPELRILKFQTCKALTGRGLRAACWHAGERLTELAVPHSDHLTDNDVEACVRACPNLKELDVTYCSLLTRGVLPLAAAARRAACSLRPLRRLRLLLSDYDLKRTAPDNHEPIETFEELDLPYIHR